MRGSFAQAADVNHGRRPLECVMPKKRKGLARSKARPQSLRAKGKTAKSRSGQKRLAAAFKSGQTSAKHRGSAVIIVSDRAGRYRVYGGRAGRVPLVRSRASGSQIAGRLGADSKILREVDRIISDLRLRKKIG